MEGHVLYLLTGEIQTGKTRWLERVTGELAAGGVPVAGVVAPGVWRIAEDGFYEKLGIDNVLLPGGERVHLACRHDLALAAGMLEARGQSERAGLRWAMSDAALEQVDVHVGRVARDSRGVAALRPGLLVIDELGRLELMRGEGLQRAAAAVAAGPTQAWPHMLVVVRASLLPLAHERFDAAWNGAVREIGPTDQARAELLARYC